MPELITSRRNRVVQHAARLGAGAEFRRREGLFLAEGARLCCDAAQSGVNIETLLFTAQAAEKYREYLSVIRAKAKRLFEVEPHIAPLLSETKTPQGVFCVCRMLRRREPAALVSLDGRYLALEEIQDPANLGAVLRTAEALGISGVLLSEGCCDLYSPKVLRASMGALFRLPVFSAGGMPETVRLLREKGCSVFAAVPDAKAKQLTQLSFRPPVALVVGNEGSGLKEETVRACTGAVTVPMAGRAESLNASASAAILMWEMMRPQDGGDQHGAG